MERSSASTVRSLGLLVALAALVGLSRPSSGWLIAGAPLVAAGQAVRIWAAGHLTKSVELVTSGPYRWIRHPLYLGRLLIFTGICLGSPLPGGLHLAVLVAGLAIFYGYYLPRKEATEPPRLEALHGTPYVRYHGRVPALLPRGRPYASASARRWSWVRFHRNREIWMVVLAVAWFTLQSGRL